MKALSTLTILAALTLPLAAACGRDQLRNLADVPLAQRNPIVLDAVWPAAVGEACVCLWKDDKVGAFSLTIDDNTRPDHAWWLEQGRKYGFHFTWFVITGLLMNNSNPGFAGTWKDFQALVDQGHDVQSHSVSHRDRKANLPMEADYGPAVTQIDTNLTGVRCLTLAYPGGALPNDPAVAARFYAGARGTRAVPNPPSPNYLETSSVSGGGGAFIEPGAKGGWASILGVVERNAQAPKAYRGWYVVHFHGVHWNPVWKGAIEQQVTALLDYVKQREDKFWVALYREAVLYGQERDTASLTVSRVAGDEIRFTLSDRMADDWYDFPLTIKVHVPQAWAAVSATQGGKAVAAAMVEHAGARYVLAQAVPDRGETILRPAK